MLAQPLPHQRCLWTQTTETSFSSNPSPKLYKVLRKKELGGLWTKAAGLQTECPTSYRNLWGTLKAGEWSLPWAGRDIRSPPISFHSMALFCCLKCYVFPRHRTRPPLLKFQISTRTHSQGPSELLFYLHFGPQCKWHWYFFVLRDIFQVSQLLRQRSSYASLEQRFSTWCPRLWDFQTSPKWF